MLFEIFITFFKIGLFTFGGGYAMIPLIEDEIVNKKKWLKSEDIIDMLALSESIPGSISINSATIMGYKLSGKAGAIAAMTGVILPSFSIITLIAIFAGQFHGSPIMDAAFLGIRCAVVILIAQSARKITKATVNDAIGRIILLSTIFLVTFTNIPAISVIILGAIMGIFTPKIEHFKSCRSLKKAENK